jgi:hypothetical protein
MPWMQELNILSRWQNSNVDIRNWRFLWVYFVDSVMWMLSITFRSLVSHIGGWWWLLHSLRVFWLVSTSVSIIDILIMSIRNEKNDIVGILCSASIRNLSLLETHFLVPDLGHKSLSGKIPSDFALAPVSTVYMNWSVSFLTAVPKEDDTRQSEHVYGKCGKPE